MLGFLSALPGLVSGIGGVANAFSAKSGNQVAPGLSQDEINQAGNNVNNSFDIQDSFRNQLAAQGGIQNQSNVFGQAQQLANMYNALAQGQGPNPAQAMLNQATGQNIAAQGALMAGQRGAAVNPGLIARQIAQQGAGIQQQAAGQAATMGAQQQIAAMQGLQGQQGLLGSIAGQQVGQQANAINSLASTALSNQQNRYNYNANQNATAAGVNRANLGAQQTALGGLASGLSSAAGFLNQPGAPSQSQPSVGVGAGSNMMPMMADGGEVPHPSGAKSEIGRLLFDALNCGGQVTMKSGGHVPGKAKVEGDSLKNDTVPAMLSPGEIVVPRSHAADPEKAAAFAKAIAMRAQKHKGK